MKTKLSETGERARDDASLCDALLWIGDPEHRDFRELWKLCQRRCDAVSLRTRLDAAIDAPPRLSIDRVLIVQSNRHDRSVQAVGGPPGLVSRLRRTYPIAKIAVVRGPLVAASVKMPPSDSQDLVTSDWIESFAIGEPASLLESWLGGRQPVMGLTERPITIVAADFAIAESMMDAIDLASLHEGRIPPTMNWVHRLPRTTHWGRSVILWDDSAAPPTTATGWQRRLRSSPNSRHVWATGMANPTERDIALENGVLSIIEKPGRLESLLNL